MMKKIKGFLLAELLVVVFIVIYIVRSFAPIIFNKPNVTNHNNQIAYIINSALQHSNHLRPNEIKYIEFADNFLCKIEKTNRKCQGLPICIITIYHNNKQIHQFTTEEKILDDYNIKK